MAACVAAALCGSTWDGGFILAGKIAAGYIGAAFAIGSSSRPAGFIIAGAAAANVVAVWVAYEFKRSHIHRQAIRRLAL
ncbi:MAG TPA: hypothetical protein VMT81_01570 [Candidatus Paceibacterota bacterium]|nr:hypothetical protein [Candidatus Paceibacterota bacterium]